ncbi:MAG: ABC transporter permease [Candidatus Sumerlaeota bacterium]|nr:ABC transporter permease [Candidatus Sumerlaeota bacterium]
MNLRRNALLSVEILAAHPLRTALSVLGIVMGIAAVILMVSLGRGAEKRIVERIRALGTNLIVVSAGQTRLIAGRKRLVATVTTLVPADAAAIARECPSVVVASPSTGKKMAIHWENSTASSNVAGMSPDGLQVRNIAVAAGRAFDPEECRGRRRVAILGPTVVRNLFGDADPIGQSIRIEHVLFETIGVAAPKGMDPNGADQDDVVIVPLETAMRRLLNVPYIQTIYAQAADGDLSGRAEEEIRALLRIRHRLGERADDFTIDNQAGLLAAERETAHSLGLLVGSVAGISLLAGGVGILAVMLMSVRERTQEIGLRRALGARRRDIRNQFLLEAVALCGAGGALGILAGIAAALILARFTQWDAVLSWRAALAAASFSVGLGIVFGLYPAHQAARLAPIAALRAE